MNTNDTSGFSDALSVAESSDVVLLVLGLNDTVSAENLDRVDILLPGM